MKIANYAMGKRMGDVREQRVFHDGGAQLVNVVATVALFDLGAHGQQSIGEPDWLFFLPCFAFVYWRLPMRIEEAIFAMLLMMFLLPVQSARQGIQPVAGFWLTCLHAGATYCAAICLLEFVRRSLQSDKATAIRATGE